MPFAVASEVPFWKILTLDGVLHASQMGIEIFG